MLQGGALGPGARAFLENLRGAAGVMIVRAEDVQTPRDQRTPRGGACLGSAGLQRRGNLAAGIRRCGNLAAGIRRRGNLSSGGGHPAAWN